jgi:hypothetical protein
MNRIEKLNNRLTVKQRKWLEAYLQCFNRAEAARVAGYKCRNDDHFRLIGYQNYVKLRDLIAQWIDENGLSEARIKEKIAAGMEAKETKFFAHQGVVVEQREVEALEIQRKYTDMAARVRGLYAPEKHELTGKDGQPISFAALVKDLSGEDEEASSENTPKLEE